jgi:hypothetical protein
MASLQSASTASPSPASGKGYDPEILDIASYVHNKTIDSELAVSGESMALLSPGFPTFPPSFPCPFPQLPELT